MQKNIIGNEIFVFGYRYGAGGINGTAYAIPTCDSTFNILPIVTIRTYVNDFIQFAKDNSDKTFHLPAIYCGLADYTAKEIAPLFKNAPDNCVLPEQWRKLNNYGCFNRVFNEPCQWSKVHVSPRCTTCKHKDLTENNKKPIDYD